MSAHCFYGFGSTVGQFAIGNILDNGVSWRNVFFGIAMIFIVVLIIFFHYKNT